MRPLQRAARHVLLGLAAAFLVVLVVSYRRPGARPEEKKDEVAPTLLMEVEQVRDRMRFRDFEYVETRPGEATYRLRASEALKFDQGWKSIFRLKDVIFESDERTPGRGVSIRAPRAEFEEGSKAFRLFDGVTIFGEDTTIKGSSFRYDPVRRLFVSESAVAAARGSLVGRADGGSVTTAEGVVILEGGVRMRGRADDGHPVDLTAPRVEMSRGGRLAGAGGVLIRTERFLLESDTFERTAEAEGDRVRAEGQARLLLAPDLPHVPAALLAAGHTIDLRRDGTGLPMALDVTTPAGLSRLDMAPASGAGARRALAPVFLSRFASGKLAEITAPEGVTAIESAPAGGPPGSGLKRLTAGYGRLVFKDGRSLEVGSFEKDVTFTDGTRATLRAPHASLRGADETAVFAGDPGVPADYRDEKGSLVATTISYARREDRVDAAGSVKASWAGESKSGLLGSSADAPLFSESDTFRLFVSRQKLILGGNVRAWQKENVLRSASLEVDDATKTLRAEGSVRAFLRREAVSAKGASGKPGPAETINTTGDLLTHRESDRFVRIEGHATMVSGTWVINSDVADIRLGLDRSVEYAEARGAVMIEDRTMHRRGEGSRATWRPQSEAVTLEGKPATALDGKGNRAQGAVLTFRQGRSQVDVETSGSVPSETVVKPEAD
jgi:lipopolysaccharide export system protein LptA